MAPRLSHRYTEALAYAAEVHAAQTRKGDAGIPYLSHLLAVSSLVIEAGGNEDEAIAALLHDAAEDQGGHARLADIEEHFGPTVARIVRECSDSLTENPETKAPWRERKEAHLDHLRSSSPSTVTVTAADKLHNARSLISDLTLEGLLYLNHFNASGEDIFWYYREMYATLIAVAAPVRLTSALGECVVELEQLMPISQQASLALGVEANTQTDALVIRDIDDWVHAQGGDLSTDEVETQTFTQWSRAGESAPRGGRYREWTVSAVDPILRTGIPMIAEVRTKGAHWQVTLKASPSQRFIAAFRSDGSWVGPDGRPSGWSNVLEGGPPQVGVRIARDYWKMNSHSPEAIHRYATRLPDARTIQRSQQ